MTGVQTCALPILKRFKYLKRLFRKYDVSKVLSERLILNHIIVLYNVFGDEAAVLLLYKIDKKYWSYLKTFLLYLNRMSPEDLSEIPVNLDIANTLRKING